MKPNQWIGAEGAAFERVSLAFESLGYRAPRADDGTDGAGAYASNIANQYVADLSQDAALAICEWAVTHSRAAIRNRYLSEREIIGMYSE